MVKYLLWYPFKGDPRVMASVRNANDEIATFEDMNVERPNYQVAIEPIKLRSCSSMVVLFVS